MGGADYDSFAPSNSFIHVKNFKSPKELAKYLLKLNESDDPNERYFDWKEDFAVDLRPLDGWCDLCKMAHDPKLPVKIYNDIRKWWMEDEGICEMISYL